MHEKSKNFQKIFKNRPFTRNFWPKISIYFLFLAKNELKQ